jgi:transcriptional regulator with XRE-family HTH domain
MQAQSITNFLPGYHAAMKTGRPSKSERSNFGGRLNALREASGLSQREVAEHLGISQPSYALWERNDVALRPDQLVKLAGILSVSVEALLHPANHNHRRGGPEGKAKRIFETVSQLPRSQQQKILEVVEAMVEKHSKAA